MPLRYYFLCLLLAGSVLGLRTAAAPRATVTALRVPDGTITLDARDTDWLRTGAALARCRIVSDTPALLLPCDRDFGDYAGPEDLSLTAYVATDSRNLYVLADVHDALLMNYADAKTLYTGDDFEVFIDAGPAAKRFTDVKAPDYRQIIFLPGHVNMQFAKPLVWQNPTGVAVASRLRPWGYTIEVKIPKALFPNWAAHPELDSIGFDLGINDADTPGVDCHHPAVKQSRLGVSLGQHFRTPVQMGQAQLELTPVSLAHAARRPRVPSLGKLRKALLAKKADDAELAQQVLDALDDARVEPVIEPAIIGKGAGARKAAVYVLAQRPALSAPVAALQAFLASTPVIEPETRIYAMLALAARGQLPVDTLGNRYLLPTTPLTLKMAYIWAMGQNHQAAALPRLTMVLHSEKNVRARMLAVLSLGLLGDQTAVPLLKEAVAKDADPNVKHQAKLALDTLGKVKGKK